MLVPPQQAMDLEQEGESNTLSKMQFDSVSSSTDPVIEEIISITSTSSFSSSSSSSSDESFDTLLELNDTKIDENKGTIPKPEQESSNDSIEFVVKQSPPVQTMGRPNNVPGYDPNRIPSNIFSTKPNSAMDWSVASNESLFSIHMGNNSFSGDHAILLGRSGEFCNFDDLISNAPSQQQPKPNEMNNSPYNNLPTVIEATTDVENSRQSLSVEENLNTEKRGDLASKTDTKVKVEDNHKETILSKNSSNISDGRETSTRDSTRASTQRFSDVSRTNSSSSFAFPVLAGEAGNYAPVKALHENTHPRHIEKPKEETQPVPHKQTQKAFRTKWFSWFRVPTFSFPRCSFCC